MDYNIPSSEIASKGRGRSWLIVLAPMLSVNKKAAYRAWIRGRAKKDSNIGSLKEAFNRATKACKKAYVRANA